MEKKIVPRTATPSAVESCWAASSTPEADPTSSMLTLVRTNRKSCAMLAPTPTPIRKRPGIEVPARGGLRAHEGQREDRGAGSDQQDAEVQQVASEPLDQRRGGEHAEDQPHDHRRQRQARVDRRPALAELAVQRDAEQQPAERAEQGQRDRDAAEVGAVVEQRRLDQRIAAVSAPGRTKARSRTAPPASIAKHQAGQPALRPWISG